MLTCNHTALHIFDFDTTINYESTHELDFDNKAVRSYVTRIVRKALSSTDNQSDQFTGNSAVAELIKLYHQSQLDFAAFSCEIADFFFGSSDSARIRLPTIYLSWTPPTQANPRKKKRKRRT
ncbi:nucleoid-associated protein [Atopobium sp. oral taxon 416]|nr:nucleoid-associated protein [Atopobium sp. oral taxon 416]